MLDICIDYDSERYILYNPQQITDIHMLDICIDYDSERYMQSATDYWHPYVRHFHW
jgi:hypothetical protein